jgi:hypothetical protein
MDDLYEKKNVKKKKNNPKNKFTLTEVSSGVACGDVPSDFANVITL